MQIKNVNRPYQRIPRYLYSEMRQFEMRQRKDLNNVRRPTLASIRYEGHLRTPTR